MKKPDYEVKVDHNEPERKDCYWRVGDLCFIELGEAPPLPCSKQYNDCACYKPRD